MTQTLAIFHDAYRALRARKMFWIVLGISGFVVLIFACLGVGDDGITFLFWELGPAGTWFVEPSEFYKFLFQMLGIKIWLSLVATVLALISTAGIFPALLAKGAVDLVVSRPISRFRLFLTQYAAGLLFVSLQVGVFCGASFLVIGLRGKVWEWGLFLAVPIVVCFFSYLFCVCALLGVLTRSTLVSLLLTMLFWVVLFMFNTSDQTVLFFRAKMEAEQEWRQVQIDAMEARAQARLRPAEKTTDHDRLRTLISERDDAAKTVRTLEKVHRIITISKTFLPKTADTINLLEYALIEAAHLRVGETQFLPNQARPSDEMLTVTASAETDREMRSRSTWWVIGTSLAFEGVVLGIGAWVFSRRDF